jgi:hypothetical protein
MAAGLSCAVIARNKLLRNKRDQPWQTQRLFATFNHPRSGAALLELAMPYGRIPLKCSVLGPSLDQPLTDGLAAVEAACGEALAAGVHSADVILNILSRRRDPEPAATILTPDALRLRHLPIADCARYDSLRRAS